MHSHEYEQSSGVPPPQTGLTNAPAMLQNDFVAPSYPSSSPSPQNYKDEVVSTSHSTAFPKSNAIETPCGVITPENLIWDPPNLKELGPLKLVGVYNLPPAFWPAILKDTVKNRSTDVDATNRADNSSNIKNSSSSVPHNTFEEHLENLDLPAPYGHENEDLFDILGISVDACDGQTETSGIIEQEEHEEKLPLSPGVTSHNMKAAATDSEELLSYVTGSRKRKRAVSSENGSCSLLDDFEICELPHALPRLDSTEHVEDFITSLCCSVFSDESIAFYY